MHKTCYLLALIILFNAFHSFKAQAQMPTPSLIGYWHNWNTASAPYIPLDQVDSRYNVIDVSFAIPAVGTDFKMEFNPVMVSQANFISQIQTVQSQGRKVIISVGGATAPVHLDNTIERDTFIATMTHIINTYGFDGIDIDLEGSSLSVSGGTISAPTDAKIINLIYATNKIMENYQAANNKKLLLTMAPETAFVQGGQSAFGGIWGAYLPFIDAMRDSLDMLHVQLYNSGSMYGIDNGIYTQGTADFIVAMVEAVIVGFSTTGGSFTGIPAHRVAVGLPACISAAGGGYTDTNQVIAAVNYLRGTGPKPGNYTLSNSGGYFNLGGMMTWSVNWDAAPSCNGVNQYANTFQTIFSPVALPITFNRFEAIKVDAGVKLSWEVYEDVNQLGYFEVERSSNGINFYSIGELKVNETIQSFSYIDNQPFEGKNYYRIAYRDMDAGVQFSPTRIITFGLNEQQIILYPNPTKNRLRLEGISHAVSLQIMDQGGRVVRAQSLNGKNVLDLSLAHLRSGIYCIQLYGSKSLLYTTSFGKLD